MDSNPCPRCGQLQSYRPADPPGGSRNQNHLVSHDLIGGSGKRAVQFKYVHPTAVKELTAPATAPIVRGPYRVVAIPVAIMEIIIVAQLSDSSVANTRPRNRSSI